MMPRARWLLSTLLFGLIVAASFALLYQPTGDWQHRLMIGGFGLSFLAALILGIVVRNRSWAMGPPLVVLFAVIMVLNLPATGPVHASTWGPITTKDGLIVFLEWGGVLLVIALAAIYAGLAALGVMIGLSHAVEASTDR